MKFHSLSCDNKGLARNERGVSPKFATHKPAGEIAREAQVRCGPCQARPASSANRTR
ncbi:hypothetical protein BN135_46 [Cronobacter muytjensii 530]